MKKKITLYGKIDQDGKAKLYKKDEFSDWAKKYTGEFFSATFISGPTRSNPQNSYYHSVVVNMIHDRFNEMGHELTLEETHEFLKTNFNFEEIEIEGHYMKKVRSTTDLTTVEFMEYLERIFLFAATVLGVSIPDPDPDWRKKKEVFT